MGEKYFVNEEPNGKIIDVECIQLNELLKIYNIKHVDFFSVDVEGAELDLLDSIDFSSDVYFKEILIEIHHHIEDRICYIKENYSKIFNIEIIKCSQTHVKLRNIDDKH